MSLRYMTTRLRETERTAASPKSGRASPATGFVETPDEPVAWPRPSATMGDSDGEPTGNQPVTFNLPLAHVVCCAGIPALIILVLTLGPIVASSGVLGGLVLGGLAVGTALGVIGVRARLRRTGDRCGGSGACCPQLLEPSDLSRDRE